MLVMAIMKGGNSGPVTNFKNTTNNKELQDVVNAAHSPKVHASHGTIEGGNSGPVTNSKNGGPEKELQSFTRRWRGQQVQPHILDEKRTTVDHFDTTKSMKRHKRRESYQFLANSHMGPATFIKIILSAGGGSRSNPKT